MTALDYKLDGFVLALPGGRAWTWVGFRLLPSAVVRRTQERLERWQSTCASCGGSIVVLARLTGGDRQRFFEQRARRGDVQVRVPDDLYPALANLTTCRACRRLEAAA